MRRPRIGAGLVVCGLFGIADGLQAAPPLSAQDRAALASRTPITQPSPALIRALSLAAQPATGDRASRPVAEAALAALQALPPSAASTTFDRAWVTLETGAALQALGRDDEARKVYEAALKLPRTKLQVRRTLIALHELGDAERPGRCPAGRWQTPPAASTAPYPPPAQLRGIEGWVDLIVDVHDDGRVAQPILVSSSLAIFEPAASGWVSALRFRTTDGAGPGRPCFVDYRVTFRLPDAADVQYPIEMVVADPSYSFRSIGAARAAAPTPGR